MHMKTMNLALATGTTSAHLSALLEQPLALFLTHSPMSCSYRKSCPAKWKSSHIVLMALYWCFTVHNSAFTLEFHFRPEVSCWICPSDCPHLLLWLFPFTMFCFTLLSSPDLFWVKLNQNLCSKCPLAADRCLLHGTRPEVIWSKGTMIWLLRPQQLFCSTDSLLLVLNTC